MPKVIRLYDSSCQYNDTPPDFLSVPDDFDVAAEWVKYVCRLVSDRQPSDEDLGPHEAARRLDTALGLNTHSDVWRTEDLFVRYLCSLPGVIGLNIDTEFPEFHIDNLPHHHEVMMGTFRVNGPTPEK